MYAYNSERDYALENNKKKTLDIPSSLRVDFIETELCCSWGDRTHWFVLGEFVAHTINRLPAPVDKPKDLVLSLNVLSVRLEQFVDWQNKWAN